MLSSPVHLRGVRRCHGMAVMVAPDDEDDDGFSSFRKPPADPVARVIDAALNAFSWAFLPLIFFVGLSLAAAGGRTFPLRVGAPPDPLAFPVPVQQQQQQRQRSSATPSQLLLLAAIDLNGRDPVLEDLRDSARSLALPPSEQRREAALQDLEDERLELCRSEAVGAFDQCFFFGSMDSMRQTETRRAMEGGGVLVRSSSSSSSSSSSTERSGIDRGRLAIPTW
jgi:hypothetical protein